MCLSIDDLSMRLSDGGGEVSVLKNVTNLIAAKGASKSSTQCTTEDFRRPVRRPTRDQRPGVRFIPPFPIRPPDFSNYYIDFAVCCPSRTSYLTGKCLHNHGNIFPVGPLGGFAGE